MDLKLVPIPSSALEGTEPEWMPFVTAIARRIRCHPEQLRQQVLSNAVHVILIWDNEAKKSVFLIGTQITLRGDDRIGELVWATGSLDGFALFDELERYHREHLGCAGMKAVARPGWSRLLKGKGYRVTHVVMEKDF